MKLQHLIDQILSTELKAEPYIDRYGGVVQTMNFEVSDDQDNSTIKRYPVACDVTGKDCDLAALLYHDLVPNDSRNSVVYWEVITPMVDIGPTGTKIFGERRFRGVARLVVWMNVAKLGGTDCKDAFFAIPPLEKILTKNLKITGGAYQGMIIRIRPKKMVAHDINSVFGKYTYPKLINYYRYPYDFFAIDVEFTLEQCLLKGGTFPIGAPLDCPNQVPIDQCTDLLAQITPDLRCSCVIPSLDFSIGNDIDFDCFSDQQIDDIIDRKSITATFYDGTNEYTNLEIDASLTFERTDAFSISCWVFPNDLSGMQGIWSKYQAPTGIFGMIDNGTVRFDLQNNGGVNGMILKTPSGLISGGVPFHSLITSDGSGTIAGSSIYIDGVLATKDPIADTLTASILTSTDFVLGGLGGGSTFMLSGLLNNFAIFDRELTAVEAALFVPLGEKDPVYTAIPNLVSHLRLTELNPLDIIGVNNGISFNQDITNIRKRLI